jgi:hypothetical protein
MHACHEELTVKATRNTKRTMALPSVGIVVFIVTIVTFVADPS